MPEAVHVEANGRGLMPGSVRPVARCGARNGSPVHGTVRWPGLIPMVEEATAKEGVAGDRDRRAVLDARQVGVVAVQSWGE
jgi:hypothetical protein